MATSGWWRAGQLRDSEVSLAALCIYPFPSLAGNNPTLVRDDGMDLFGLTPLSCLLYGLTLKLSAGFMVTHFGSVDPGASS